LKITDAIDTLGDVQTLFQKVPKGELLLDAGVTAAIKPSVLVDAIKTTALRRLTIDTALTAGAPDTVTELSIPAGMTFETADPLSQLESLTVAGDFTASVATFTRLTSLTVSGTLSAGDANYGDVTSLVVDSVFNAGAKPFPKLETLTVNAGGNFVTTGNIGATATDFAGTTIVVAANGAASVGEILKLNTSPISGSLSATRFTVNGTATLTAADGGTINGVTFPAATLAITSLAADTITIDDYTVPRDTTLDVGAGKTLVIPTGKKLTIAQYGLTSGTGVIKAQGTTVGGTIVIDGVVDYITEASGVTGANLRPAVLAMTADTVKLTDKAAINLATTFGGTGPTPGIGSVAITSTTAVQVTTAPDAEAGGSNITLGEYTGIAVAPTTITASGNDSATTTASFVLSVTTGAFKLEDSAWNETAAKTAILKFTGLKLKNSGLIAPAVVPDFSIGVKTSRSS
jgi:hypothetical protein